MESHSTISDNDLDLLVRGILQITPRIGYRLVQGALRSRGLRIQRRRVLESLQRVDPVTVTMRASRSMVLCTMPKCIVVGIMTKVAPCFQYYFLSISYYNSILTGSIEIKVSNPITIQFLLTLFHFLVRNIYSDVIDVTKRSGA